jgi:hypothetical protein
LDRPECLDFLSDLLSGLKLGRGGGGEKCHWRKGTGAHGIFPLKAPSEEWFNVEKKIRTWQQQERSM